MTVDLETIWRGGAWWVTGLPDNEPDCGPYKSRAEAESDRVGMTRFFRDIDKPETFTSEGVNYGKRR